VLRPLSRWRRALAACGLLLVLAGCAPAEPTPRPTPSALRPSPTILVPPRPPPRTIELGRSVRNRPIEAQVFDGSAGCILIVGGLHGDESLSPALVERLSQHLDRDPEARANRCIVLVPRANPDGLAAGTRANARGVDLNRNFPASNYRPGRDHGAKALSEPETRALYGALTRYHPSCVVAIHGPLNGVDPDGGAASRQLARDMANVGPLPYRDLPAHPGSLGSYAAYRLGVKMITYELDSRRGASRSLDRHLSPLLYAIRNG
jgi:hypothetical protein